MSEVNTYLRRGNAYFKKGDYNHAIEDYSLAIRINPKNALLFHLRGVAYCKKNNFDNAIVDFTQEIRLNPVEEAYVQRGKAYYSKQNLDNAIDDFTQAIRINPDYAKAYLFRGVAFQKKGMINQAVSNIKTALRIVPDLYGAEEKLEEARQVQKRTKRIISVKTLAAIGIGSALFFVLMRFVAIPSGVPNTNLNIGIAGLSFFAGVFGPLAGLLIGFIGHTLTDLTWADMAWGGVWWSWVIADAFYGLAVGLFWKLFWIEEGEFCVKQAVVFNIVQIAANILAWVAIAPTLDILMYNEPLDKVYRQGLVSASLNVGVVLILGTILAFGYSKTRTESNSLQKE